MSYRYLLWPLLLLLTLACASAPARLEYGGLESKAMGHRMEYAVYQPLDRKPEERLPLVIFLHGAGDDPHCFDEAGVGQHLDAAIREGRAPRVVIAIPEGDLGFWENWADGSRNYRDWVLDELLPEVQGKYGTAACPQGCHVMGISMGGFGALRFALLAPEHFSTVTALSAPIFDSEQMLDFRNSFWLGLIVPMRRIWGEPDRQRLAEDDLYLRWTRQPDLRGLRLMLAWGDHDKSQILEANVKFRAHLNAHGIVHESQVFAGKHDWKSWTPVLERALHVQLTEPANTGSPRVTPGATASALWEPSPGGGWLKSPPAADVDPTMDNGLEPVSVAQSRAGAGE